MENLIHDEVQELITRTTGCRNFKDFEDIMDREIIKDEMGFADLSKGNILVQIFNTESKKVSYYLVEEEKMYKFVKNKNWKESRLFIKIPILSASWSKNNLTGGEKFKLTYNTTVDERLISCLYNK